MNHKSEIDSWDKRPDVPQYGGAYLQFAANRFFKDAKPNQLVSIYAIIEFIGQPSNLHGMGVYRVEHCLGYPELIGQMYSVGYSRITESKRI